MNAKRLRFPLSLAACAMAFFGLHSIACAQATNDLPENTTHAVVDASDDDYLIAPDIAFSTFDENTDDSIVDPSGIEWIDDGHTPECDIDNHSAPPNITEITLESPSSEMPEMRLPNPEYLVENIHIAGNTHTSRERILRIMQLDESKKLTLEALEDCRIRLALSGLFENVEMNLIPGAQRSSLKIDIYLKERSPLQINQYFFGTDAKSPYWHGLDLTWLGAFHPFHQIRMIYAATSSNDFTIELQYRIPTIHDLPISITAGIHALKSHEGIYGIRPIQSPSHFGAHPPRLEHIDDLAFQRHGASLGVGYALASHWRFSLRTSYSRITRQNRLMTVTNSLHDYLSPGASNLFDLGAAVAFDTRTAHEMPNDGHYVSLFASGTFKTHNFSSYEYIRLALAHQSNIQLSSPVHILRINTFIGGVFGDAPFFEKFFFNDFYDLAPSRIAYLNPSQRGAFDLFSTGADTLGYEDYIARLSISYAWQPVEQKIEFFALVSGIWSDSAESYPVKIANPSNAKRDTFPVDLSLNAGIRLKTDYGLFSLTLAHIFNLIPR